MTARKSPSAEDLMRAPEALRPSGIAMHTSVLFTVFDVCIASTCPPV